MTKSIALMLICTLLNGCALVKIITIPIKATAKVVGGTAKVAEETADVID